MKGGINPELIIKLLTTYYVLNKGKRHRIFTFTWIHVHRICTDPVSSWCFTSRFSFQSLKSVLFISELEAFSFTSQTGRLCEARVASCHKEVNFRLIDWGVKLPCRVGEQPMCSAMEWRAVSGGFLPFTPRVLGRTPATL